MSKKNNKITGIKGEAIAEDLLRGEGYKIIDRNFRTRFGEIDIVAERDDTIYIIEVRARYGRLYGRPEDSLNYHKLKKLKRMTLYYLQRFKGLKLFEVIFISIVMNNGYATKSAYYERRKNILPPDGELFKYNITEGVMSS
jgi:putative endonuclease